MESTKKRARSEEMTDSQAQKKQILEKVTGSSSLLPTNALLDNADKEDFRIVVGTYERLLFGVNATWNDQVSLHDISQPIFFIDLFFGRKPKSSSSLCLLFQRIQVVFVL
jgi:protein MAK11